MDQARLDFIWTQCGKVIRLAEVGVAAASGLKDHAVAMAAQFSREAGGPDDWAPISTYVVPLTQRLAPIVNSLERIDVVAKASMESFLRTLTPELGLSSSASTSTVLDELADRMNALSYTIQPSGRLWGWWRDAYAFDGFPTSGSPDVTDDIVTTIIL